MQTVSISSPVLDITSQWFFLNRNKLHKFKAGDTEGHILLKDRILEPVNCRKCISEAASICISLNHPVLSSIALSPGDNNVGLDAYVGT